MSGSMSRRLRVAVFLGSVALAAGQTNLEPSHSSIEALLNEVREMRAALDAVRGELAGTRRESQELRTLLDENRDALEGSRREAQELRKEIETMRQQWAEVRAPAIAPAPAPVAAAPAAAGDRAAEDRQVIEAKLADLEQTKVASGSRYRVRLSGLALFNAANTRGAVDQIDLPLVAEPKSAANSGGFNGTLRQSVFSLEVFGPEWRGAKTSGELTVDFFGGFPFTPEGATAGLLRLRTAKASFDWKNTSVVAGQDAPFFSPRSPTSLAATAYPALSYAGNLWTWTPQIHVEHRWSVSGGSRISLAGGVLDPLSGEFPASEYERMPTAGERSRMPAYAARLGWQRSAYDSAAGLGAGTYYSRQKWEAGERIDSWVAAADWNVPLGPWFWLSGELYRGRAMAGLGGGANGSVAFTSAAAAIPIDSAGGWTQLKFKPLAHLEWNAAIGEDHGFFSRARAVEIPVRRNASGMINVIYQPRSSLVFSLEYRRLRTVRASGPATADHINLAAGILF